LLGAGCQETRSQQVMCYDPASESIGITPHLDSGYTADADAAADAATANGVGGGFEAGAKPMTMCADPGAALAILKRGNADENSGEACGHVESVDQGPLDQPAD